MIYHNPIEEGRIAFSGTLLITFHSIIFLYDSIPKYSRNGRIFPEGYMI